MDIKLDILYLKKYVFLIKTMVTTHEIFFNKSSASMNYILLIAILFAKIPVLY